jgi:DNA-binding NarL/FixJ family response regulator
MANARRREVSVLVVDDHAATRRFLTILLEESSMEVVGEAGNGNEAVLLCEQLRPDIVVLDISMPVLNGIEAAREIAKRSPATKIVFLTSHTSEEFAGEALRVGGLGFVYKDHATQDLLEAIDAVLQGKTYISDESAA